MRITDAEFLLALRSPSSGHLATLICTLTEALDDPGFSKHHRLLVGELLTRTQVTATVAAAAEVRMQKFATDLATAAVTGAADPAVTADALDTIDLRCVQM